MDTYPIPDEVATINLRALAAEDVRDKCVKVPFGYRKALRAASDKIKYNRKFWK